MKLKAEEYLWTKEAGQNFLKYIGGNDPQVEYMQL